MSFRTSIACRIALAGGFALAMSAAHAQQPAPVMPNLATASGQMHAAAELCGDYKAAQLDAMKQQQRTAASQSGMSAGDFDTAFKTSYDSTKVQLAQLSAADKDKMCQQLRAVMPKQ